MANKPNVKTIEEFEKQKNMIIPNVNPKDKISEEEFDSLRSRVGVDHEKRVKFLRENGYEVNRKNMIDHKLSARG